MTTFKQAPTYPGSNRPADYHYTAHLEPGGEPIGTVQRTGPTGAPRSWIAHDLEGRYAGMHGSRVAAGLELARIARDPAPEPVTGEPIALPLEENPPGAPESPGNLELEQPGPEHPEEPERCPYTGCSTRIGHRHGTHEAWHRRREDPLEELEQ